MTQALHWAASSKAVPTSTTTGVLWSQVSAALCPPSPRITRAQSTAPYPCACVQVQWVTARASSPNLFLAASNLAISFGFICPGSDSDVFAQHCAC